LTTPPELWISYEVYAFPSEALGVADTLRRLMNGVAARSVPYNEAHLVGGLAPTRAAAYAIASRARELA